MPKKDSGPKAGLEGIVEDVKGKVKEVAGRVTGRDDLEDEGEAQQEKAGAKRDVAEHEAKAEAGRAKAEEREAEQRVHQSRQD
jgi:uncharacterized protein YjbJ (UPF0337 family)